MTRTFKVTVSEDTGVEVLRIKGASHFLYGGRLWVYDDRGSKIATINNVTRVVTDEAERKEKSTKECESYWLIGAVIIVAGVILSIVAITVSILL